MTPDLHDLRNTLVQALNKIDTLIGQNPDPRLPILTAWLAQASQHQMHAAQLYVLVKEEFRDHNLPVPTQWEIGDLLRSLGYVNKRSHAGMRWSKP